MPPTLPRLSQTVPLAELVRAPAQIGSAGAATNQELPTLPCSSSRKIPTLPRLSQTVTLAELVHAPAQIGSAGVAAIIIPATLAPTTRPHSALATPSLS